MIFLTYCFVATAQEYQIGLVTKAISEVEINNSKIKVSTFGQWQRTKIKGDSIKILIHYHPTLDRFFIKYREKGLGKYRIGYTVNQGSLISLKAKARDNNPVQDILFEIPAYRFKMKLNVFQGEYIGIAKWKTETEVVKRHSFNLVLPPFSEYFEVDNLGLTLIIPSIKEVQTK